MQKRKPISIMVVNPTKRKRSKNVKKKRKTTRRPVTRRRTTRRRTTRRRSRPVAVAVANPKGSTKKGTQKKTHSTYRPKRKAYITRVTKGKPKYHLLKQNPETLATQANPAKTTWDLVVHSAVSTASQAATQLLTGYIKTKVNDESEPTKTNMLVEVGVPLGVVAGSAFISKGKNQWLNALAVGAAQVCAENSVALLLANIDKSGKALTYQKLGDSKESINKNITIPTDDDDDDNRNEAAAEPEAAEALEGFGSWGSGEGDYGSGYQSRYLLGSSGGDYGSGYQSRYLLGNVSRFHGNNTVSRFHGNNTVSRFHGSQDNYTNRYMSGTDNNLENRFPSPLESKVGL